MSNKPEQKRPIKDRVKSPFNVSLLFVFCAFLAGIFFSPSAFALAGNVQTDQELAKEECSACHYYYAREFLPAFSWKKIMDNLSNHFGEDASLDADSRHRILSYLAGLRSTEIPIRITDLAWWKQVHGASFQTFAARNHIKSSNCGSCHR